VVASTSCRAGSGGKRVRERRIEELDRDLAPQHRIAGADHLAHAASPQGLEDLVSGRHADEAATRHDDRRPSLKRGVGILRHDRRL